MNLRTRGILNRSFTFCCSGSVAIIAAALVIILAPMMYTGVTAILFRGTHEFRAMQLELFERGNPETLQAEAEKLNELRQPIYDMLSHFERGIDTERLKDQAKTIYRDYGKKLRYDNVPGEVYISRRRKAREIRDLLTDAYETPSKAEALEYLEKIDQHEYRPNFADTHIDELFQMSDEYKEIVKTVDLGRREEYLDALEEVKMALHRLFGPRPGAEKPPLAMNRYGATRWDQVQTNLELLVYAQQWVQEEPGEPAMKKLVPRAETQFAGTALEPMFAMVENNIEELTAPEPTFYWQYFIDDSTPGYFFGGVGPEILGTLLITLGAMIFATPLGIISAWYLVEFSKDGRIVQLIRSCVNTLAGVPSIVFGLFGLAFFLMFFFPRVGLSSEPSILAGSLTLGLLVLPVVIRASEEAIRSVPQSYKEASLALGAGEFRTFLTVTLPAALPGVLTGIILSVSRAAGETAPILFIAAIASGPVPDSVLDPTRTLSYGSYVIATGDRIAMRVPHNQYGMVATLIALVLLLNIVAIILRSKMARRLKGY